MKTEISEKMKDTIKHIIEKTTKELKDCKTREEVITKYFYFDYHKKYNTKEKRLEDFFEQLEMLSHFAKQWEEVTNGAVMSIDRVRKHFLRPQFKKYCEEK